MVQKFWDNALALTFLLQLAEPNLKTYFDNQLIRFKKLLF